MAQLNWLASLNPNTYFLLKPHHASIWTSSRRLGAAKLPANILLADPLSAAWEPYTAEQLLTYTAAVITTPSTVALDAAAKSIPLAVAAGELTLDFYRPLTLLCEQQDWVDFLATASALGRRPSLIEKSRLFFGKYMTPGSAAERIAGDMRSASRTT